jgi:DNA-binding GntR family transcriptional regulator
MARSQALAFYQHQILEQLFIRMRSYFEKIEDVEQVIFLHERTLSAIASRNDDLIRAAVDEHLQPLEQVVHSLSSDEPVLVL